MSTLGFLSLQYDMAPIMMTRASTPKIIKITKSAQKPSDEAFRQWSSSSLLFSSGVVVVLLVAVVLVVVVVLLVVVSSTMLMVAFVVNVKVTPKDPVYVLVIVYVSEETSEGLEIDTFAVVLSNVSQLGKDDPSLWAKVILLVKLALDATVTTS